MTSFLFDDLMSLYFNDDHHNTLQFTSKVDNCDEVMKNASRTEFSDDLSLTNDDLIVLNDLFGFATPASNLSNIKPKQANSAGSCSHKRPRSMNAESDALIALPKSQQQRQKLEIESLRNQVAELQATIEKLHARKLERKRQKLQPCSSDHGPTLDTWKDSAKSHIAAIRQLEEQNKKLYNQVAAHVGQLQRFEHIARTQCVVQEPMQVTQHCTTNYSSSY